MTLNDVFCVIRERKFLVSVTRDLDKTKSMIRDKKKREEKIGLDYDSLKGKISGFV